MKEPQVQSESRTVRIPCKEVHLMGELEIPVEAEGIVLFAHGTGRSRFNPGNQFVARYLAQKGIATLLFDLLTLQEELQDRLCGHLRFDTPWLAERLVFVTRWLQIHEGTEHLVPGYFGVDTGGAAALMAAAELNSMVRAVVLRCGRPDLVVPSLHQVKAPTLLIVGEKDETGLRMSELAYDRLACEKERIVIPGATHLEKRCLKQVAYAATEWFELHLQAPSFLSGRPCANAIPSVS